MSDSGERGQDFTFFITLMLLCVSITFSFSFDCLPFHSLPPTDCHLLVPDTISLLCRSYFRQIAIIVFDRICLLFRSIRGKFLLQYATFIYWTVLIFFVWPKDVARMETCRCVVWSLCRVVAVMCNVPCVCDVRL